MAYIPTTTKPKQGYRPATQTIFEESGIVQAPQTTIQTAPKNLVSKPANQGFLKNLSSDVVNLTTKAVPVVSSFVEQKVKEISDIATGKDTITPQEVGKAYFVDYPKAVGKFAQLFNEGTLSFGKSLFQGLVGKDVVDAQDARTTDTFRSFLQSVAGTEDVKTAQDFLPSVENYAVSRGAKEDEAKLFSTMAFFGIMAANNPAFGEGKAGSGLFKLSKEGLQEIAGTGDNVIIRDVLIREGLDEKTATNIAPAFTYANTPKDVDGVIKDIYDGVEIAKEVAQKEAEQPPSYIPTITPETELPPLPKFEAPKVKNLPTQATTEGTKTKQVINKSTNVKAPTVKVTKTDTQLLKAQLKAEVRSSRAGYKAGYTDAKESITNQLRNTFGTKIENIKRGNDLDKLKTNIVSRDADRVRGEIVDFVKNNITKTEQGKFLVTVKNAKTQKDLIKAFTRIDTRANQINLDRAVKQLKKTTDSLMDDSSVSADYRNRIRDIISEYELSGHSNATIAKLEGTEAFIKRMEKSGQEVDIPRRILEKLAILSRTPKSKLKLADVERLQKEVELLAKLGKTKWKTKQALYEGEKALRKEELLNTAAPINSSALPIRDIGSKPKLWTQRYIKLRNLITKSRVGLRPVDGFAEITGMTPMKQTFDADFNLYLNREIPGVSNFRKLESEMLEAGQALTQGQRERVGVYGHRLQEDGYEKLANSGITREQADAVTLTPEEKKFYDSIQAFNEATFESVKKYSQDVYNVDVGKVENYMSYQTDFDAISDLEVYDRFGDRTADAIGNKTKTVEQGFTKKRTGAGEQKVQIDALKIAQRHADDVAYMLTMGRDTKQYFEILNSPDMRKKLGDIGTLAWLEYVDLLARKGGTASSQRIAALDILRQNLGAGVLGFRLSSVAVQVTSFADAIATIGVEAASKGAKNIATSKEWRNFVMDNFPEIRAAVGDDVAFREFSETYLGKAQKVGMQPLVALDGVMRSSAAAGAYEMLAKKAGKVVDFANPDKKLIQEATKLMRDSQGSSFFKDQPLALSTGFGLTGNKSINKTIFTFQSFLLNRWENIERQIWRLGIKEKNYAKAGMSAFWLLAFAAMAEETIRTGVEGVTNAVTGQEAKERDFVGNSAMNVLEGIPLLGSVVSSINYSSNPVPVINTAEEILGGVGSVATGKEPETKLKGAIKALGGLGSLSGVPGSSQASQLLRGSIQTPTKSNDSIVPELPELPKLPKLPSLPSL